MPPLALVCLEFYSIWFGFCLQFNVESSSASPLVTKEGRGTEPLTCELRPPGRWRTTLGFTCTDLSLAPANPAPSPQLTPCPLRPLRLSLAADHFPVALQNTWVSHSSKKKKKTISRSLTTPLEPHSRPPSALNSNGFCPCLFS